MKKLLAVIIFSSSLILLGSCAKPTVVTVVMPGDEGLSCSQLKNEVSETQRFKREAEDVKGGTGGNITRGIFFWPAIIQSYSNANEAIAAANSRKVHLFNIMNDRKCKGVGELVVQTTTILQEETKSSEENLAQELRGLAELHKSGILTDEEFSKAKSKILGN
mgnify:CR=1 FL=1